MPISTVKRLPGVYLGGAIVLAVIALVFISEWVIAYPLPIVDTVFGPDHVYSRATLSDVIDKLHLPGKVLASNYSATCGFESGALTLTGKNYRCTSIYNQVFASSNPCLENGAVYAAMVSGGYSYNSATKALLAVNARPTTCGSSTGDSLPISFVSDSLVSLSHGTGRIDCYFPAYTLPNSGDNFHATDSNNYNCAVVIDTDQRSNPPTN